MQRRNKLFLTEPFIINTEKLKILYDFILSFSEFCYIEIVSISPKAKEVREFKSFEEFSCMKNLITNKISKIRFKAYKENKEIIKLELINPKGKIFPFLDSYTLKSSFNIKNEENFKVFITSYKEIIESMISYKRRAYKSLHAFLTAFFSVLFTTVYALMLVRAEESSSFVISISLALFLLFSIAFNIFFYPFLYLHNPLVRFELGIDCTSPKGMYLMSVINFIKINAKQIFFALLAVFFISCFSRIFALLMT